MHRRCSTFWLQSFLFTRAKTLPSKIENLSSIVADATSRWLQRTPKGQPPLTPHLLSPPAPSTSLYVMVQGAFEPISPYSPVQPLFTNRLFASGHVSARRRECCHSCVLSFNRLLVCRDICLCLCGQASPTLETGLQLLASGGENIKSTIHPHSHSRLRWRTLL